MRVQQSTWSPDGFDPPLHLREAQLVLVFGSGPLFEDPAPWDALRTVCPSARLVGCSTAGEIADTQVHDDHVVATAVHFDTARIECCAVDVAAGGSHAAGARLAAGLPTQDLRHVIVFADGQVVNGSTFAKGLRDGLPDGVTATGGLAGDGSRFERTLVAANGDPRTGRAVAIGLYGPIEAGYGSLGGWDPFGPERIVTRSKDNVLYELDGYPALDLYKTYLGDHAGDLPASGLLFPLRIMAPGGQDPLVRTILAVNEADKSLVFAGDLPEGSVARLMKANFERLVDGAEGAAKASLQTNASDLAILVSCIGRKLVLKQRTEEELEAVRHILGPTPHLTGFYSYGEICPAAPGADCELHNQTMTITTIREQHASTA